MNRSNDTGRYRLLRGSAAAQRADFAREVRSGLTASPKYLPCRYFYDREGSRLFDRICRLPVYYLSQAEAQILRRQSDAISARLVAVRSVIELGCGSASKTRILLETLLKDRRPLHYGAIDLSEAALGSASSRLLRNLADLRITAVVDEYLPGMERLAGLLEAPRLILFLGSNIGNFDRDAAVAFLAQVTKSMSDADAMLLGVDLRKETTLLEQAYNDAQGVTAAFNKNILARINRELGGEFCLDSFHHRAIYNQRCGRIEMYLNSACSQAVPVASLGLTVPFEQGEATHTENSYKYSLDEVATLADRSGLTVARVYLDDQERFCLAECRPAETIKARGAGLSPA